MILRKILPSLLFICLCSFYPGTSIFYKNFSSNWDTYDFGNITTGDKVSCTLCITNTSNAPIIINNIIPSCKCLTLNKQSGYINPGGKLKIKIHFDSTGKALGEEHQNVIVCFSDESYYSFELKVFINAKT